MQNGFARKEAQFQRIARWLPWHD